VKNAKNERKKSWEKKKFSGNSLIF